MIVVADLPPRGLPAAFPAETLLMFLRCSLSVVAVAAMLAVAPAQDVPAGFKAVFNGKDLDGWQGYAVHAKGASPADMAKLKPEERAAKFAEWTIDAKKHWSVEKGELVNDGNGAYLATVEEFGDVEFLIEYKTVPKADSGIYMKSAPQVQIWDSTETAKFNLGADKGSGGLWNNSKGAAGKDPLVKADKPFGEWNKFRILMIGEYVTIYLNDQLVVDHARMENYFDRKMPLQAKAPIILQTHGGEIRWRNVYARTIPADEANAMILKKATGFKPMFDGKSLAGWQGATDEYEVIDGAIVNKKGKGGNLFTKDEYGDFTAIVEYKLPHGGNNGLAIRYPGTGDPSISGFCEVQILDDTAKQYAKLDPRQYNGSAYGVLPVARGYLRSVGEWNLMQVKVVGSTIQVELNGTRVLDGDVATVKEKMRDAKTPHTGITNTKGYFGFAGHGDPVAFRTVLIGK